MKVPRCGNVCAKKHPSRGSAFSPAGRAFRRVMGHLRRPAALAGALTFFAPLVAFSQNTAAPARITARIDETRLTTLRGDTHPLARAQYDRGAVADSQPLRRMLLLLKRSSEQEAALRTLIDQQQSKGSPNFHQWLTPQQIGRQFGPAQADIQTVTGWLQSQGFQIARISAGGTLIEFSGTAGQVLRSFHTQIHRYVVNRQEHFANSSDPQIPAALAPVVAGPVSLHNFGRKAQSRNLGVFKKDLTTGKVVPQFSFGCLSNSGATVTCNALGPGDFAKIYNVQSLWDSGVDGTGQTIAIVGDSEICTAASPDFSTTCAGNDDVETFRSIFGLPTANLPNVIVDGPDPGFNNDEIEGNLDVQWSGGVAKGATIDFVIAETTEASAGVDLAAEYIVDNNLAPVMSESFGSCEASLGTGGNEFYSELWEQAAAQGITVIVSAGDNGSAGCDDQTTETAAGQNGVNFGPGVNGIASTIFDVATGGTDFDITAPAYQTTYWGAETSDLEGVQHISALSYVPETTWNDSCAQNFTGAPTGCSPPPSVASLNIVAGSGGQSNCIQQDFTGACVAFYNKPSWQAVAAGSGFTAGNDLARDLPDISLFAADGAVSNSFYAICDANFSSGPCNATPGSIDVIGVGGTSSSAPTLAGIMALVNQAMTTLHGTNPNIPTSQGNANYVLYHLFANQSGSCTSTPSALPASTCTFNDVVRGNNSVPCVGTTSGCSDVATAGAFGALETVNPSNGLPSGTLAFNSGTGYDMASGLGSINAANLVSNWGTAVGAFQPTTTTLCLWTGTSTTCPSPVPTSISLTHGQQVNVEITVSPNPFAAVTTIPEDAALVGTFAGGTPGCGAPACNTSGVDHFDFPLNNVDIYPLASNGTVTGSTAFLVGGNYSVVAHYAGDGTNGASFSTTPIAVSVSPEASTTQVSTSIFNFFSRAAASSSSAYYGDSIIIRADVVGSSSGQESATGSITLSDGSQNLGAFPLNAEGYAEDQTASNVTGAFTQPLAVGAHSFTATFGGDPSYSASSTSAAVALAVVQAPTTAVVTPSVTSVAANTAFTVSAFVDTQSNNALSSGGSSGAAPTGTVTFFAGATQLGTSPVTATLDSNLFVAGQATLSNVTLASTASITAVYDGDTNYTASPTSPAVAVTVTGGPVPTITLLPAAGSVTVNVSAPGQSGQTMVTVNGSNGFSGAVTLSASVSPANLSDPPRCTFAVNPVTLSSTTTSAQTSMTCNTTAVSAQIAPVYHRYDPNWPLWSELAGVAFIISFLGMLGLTSQKRRAVATVTLVLLAAVAIMVGCGSSGGTGGANSGTAVGTYTVTVMATPPNGSGAVAQSTTITLAVQ